MSMHELYQQLIMDHSRSSAYKGKAQPCTHSQHGHNPLCGDSLEITLCVQDGIIQQAKFSGEGCAISKASASLMCEAIVGLSEEQAQDLFKQFHSQMMSEGQVDLGKLNALSNVKAYPMRLKCATLSWHTMSAALNESTCKVTTE